MSNTIKSSKTFQFIRDNVVRKQVPGKEYTIATTSELAPITEQIVGTTHELIAAGDVTDTAYCEIEVLHATAEVSIGHDAAGTFVPWYSMKKGDPPAVLPRVAALASTYLKSDTASTTVGITLVKIVAPL